MTIQRLIALPFAILLASLPQALGQTAFEEFLQTHELHITPIYQTWSSGRGDQIFQVAMPIVYILPVAKAVSVDVSAAFARSHLSEPSQSIIAMTDTRVRASWVTLDNTLLVTGGVVLPTGHSALTPDERVVAASLANPALDFPVSYYGQGTGFTAGLAYAVELQETILGFGLGTYIRGSFKPSSEVEAKYRPGSEITALISAERTFRKGSTSWRILGDIDYTWYDADTYDGERVYRSGNRWMFNFQTELRTRTFRGLFFVQDRAKGKNERGLGSLLPEPVNTNGNQLDIIVDGTVPVGRGVNLRGLLQSKLYGKNDYGNNGAAIFGGGPGLEYQVSAGLWIELALHYFGGSLRSDAGNTTVSSFLMDLAFRMQF